MSQSKTSPYLCNSSRRPVISPALPHDGLIQLVRDFCNQSNSICQNWKLPYQVKEKLAAQFLPNPFSTSGV